jgi:hypothetical protein
MQTFIYVGKRFFKAKNKFFFLLIKKNDVYKEIKINYLTHKIMIYNTLILLFMSFFFLKKDAPIKQKAYLYKK